MSIITLVLLQKWLQALITCLRPGSTNRSKLSLGREIAGFRQSAEGLARLKQEYGKTRS